MKRLKMDFSGLGALGQARKEFYAHLTGPLFRNRRTGSVLWSSVLDGKAISLNFRNYGCWVLALRALSTFRHEYFLPGYDFSAHCYAGNGRSGDFSGMIVVRPVPAITYAERVKAAVQANAIATPTYSFWHAVLFRLKDCNFYTTKNRHDGRPHARRGLSEIWPHDHANPLKRLIDYGLTMNINMAFKVVGEHQMVVGVESLEDLLRLEYRFHQFGREGDDLLSKYALVAVRDERRLMLMIRYPTRRELRERSGLASVFG